MSFCFGFYVYTRILLKESRVVVRLVGVINGP